MNTGKSKLILELPKDKLKVLALNDKLDEYERRVSTYISQHPSMSPEIISISAPSFYNFYLLNLLFEKGKLDPDEAFYEIWREYGAIDRNEFSDAVNIIADYITSGGKNCVGGTGLKFFSGASLN